METNTIVILAVVIICLILVGLNRYHHRQHHFNEEDLRQAVKDILSLQPDHILPRADFTKALRDHYNCDNKEALWLLGRAKEKGFVKYDDKWVEEN
jgi:hypothetical protein